jgi:hypothetical protein
VAIPSPAELDQQTAELREPTAGPHPREAAPDQPTAGSNQRQAAPDRQTAGSNRRQAGPDQPTGGSNRRQAAPDQSTAADHGSRLDDARQAAASARAAAAAATAQAHDMHAKARENLDLAERFEADADAAQRAADGTATGREMADDMREQAQLLRAGATSYTQRADRCEQIARHQLEQAAASDRQAVQIERSQGDQPAYAADAHSDASVGYES